MVVAKLATAIFFVFAGFFSFFVSSVVFVVLCDRLRVSRRALSPGRRRLCCHRDRCFCCGRSRYRLVRCDSTLDFRCRRRSHRASIRGIPVLSYSSVVSELDVWPTLRIDPRHEYSAPCRRPPRTS